MRDWPREVFIAIEPGLRIRYCRSESPPPVTYAVVLEALVDGAWETVRLWDNVDNPDVHHEHAYLPGQGKQPPATLRFTSSNDAMSAAIRKARTECRTILRRWREDNEREGI